MNMLADRLRDTEADLKQAQEAFEFKCKEVDKLQNEIKKTRGELAKERQLRETEQRVWKEMQRFLLEKFFDDDAIKYLVERMLRK